MKKVITTLGLLTVAITLNAAKGDQSKDQYVAKDKVKWEKNGWKWNQAKVESNFIEVDTNKDGIASGLERKAWFAKKKAEKAKK